MEIEASKFHNGMNINEEDIENIERLAEGLANTHNGTHHNNEKERKKKFSKKPNKFDELNYYLNTIPGTKKMTREEKKLADVSRLFTRLEETGNENENEIHEIKGKIEIEDSIHEDEKNKESNSNIEAISLKTTSKSQADNPAPQKIKAPDTQINPSFNLETYDNLFYYLYYYVKSERKIIEDVKEKEFNGEQVSSFRFYGKPKRINEADGVENGNLQPKRITKVDETVFQKTKFIQDSIRRKFKENMEKMNSTAEKDLLVREFSKKYINKEEINNLLETEFSYY